MYVTIIKNKEEIIWKHRTTTLSSTDSHSYGYLVSVDYLVSYDYYLVMPDGSVVQAKKASFVAAFPVLKDKINSIIKLRKLKLARKEDVLYLYDYCLHELNQH